MKKLHRFTKALFDLAEQKPVAKISVEELCNKVGVKRQTFYYHFKDMGDLIKAIMIDFCEHRIDKEGGLPEDARFVAELYAGHSDILKNFLTSPYATEMTNFLHSYLYTRSYNRITTNPKYKNLPAEQLQSVSRIVASILVTELSFWIKSGMKEDKEFMLNRFRVMLKNIKKMMVENSLRDNLHREDAFQQNENAQNKH